MSVAEGTRGEGVRRLEAGVAFFFIGVLYLLLPQRLRLGPRWPVPVIVGALLLLIFLAHARGYHQLSHWLGRAATCLATLAVASIAAFMVFRLPAGKVSGRQLLAEAGATWAANVLVFALWYWEIDGGGPAQRQPGRYHSRDFVFPQIQQDPIESPRPWMPELIDYVFLAFNTSTAFSPTDTLVLSRRAKLLLMAQSLISLLVIALLAARAINTL